MARACYDPTLPEVIVPMRRPLALIGVAAAFLTIALACGGGSEPEQDDEPTSTTPSLGDLLGAQSSPTSTTPSAGTQPTTQLPELPDLEVVPTPAEPEIRETAECTQARAELKAEREAVDARRAREIEGAERALARGQLAMQNCLKTSPCNVEAKMMAAAQEQEQAGEAAYQAAMQRIARYEAGLFEYEQAVDRACGRR